MNSFTIPGFDSEEMYKELFDSAHDLIHFARIDGELLYVNKSWVKLLGYTAEEIAGKSIFSFIHPEDREKFRYYRARIVEGVKEDREILIRASTKKGETRCLEGFVSVKHAAGDPLYTRGIFRDVSTRIENEARLKSYNEQLVEREQNLQQFLMNAPDAVIVIDQESLVRFWNPKAEQIFGWKEQEVLGHPLAEAIIPEKYREAHENGMRRYLATGEARVLNKTIEITAINKEGREFYVSLTISTTKRKGDTAFIAFLRDITEQKTNELELEKKSRELEASNQQLENFAHAASHDMKEPIRKIKIFAGRLEEEFKSRLPEGGRTYLTKVLESAERLTQMVEGVLNYSSVNSIDPSFELIDLKIIVNNIQADLELAIQNKNAQIQYRDVPAFEGAPFLIYQLFYNLINNSLKFSISEASPLIVIEGRILQGYEVPEALNVDDISFVEVLVTDNGIGFNQEDAQKIFGSFTRLHSKHVYEGTGLGLALCKNIVERHHGFISARGEEGKGAQFRILLPQKRQGE